MSTVLHVDDSETMCQMVKMCLSNNYNVLVAKDGIAGVEAFKNFKIDLIVTDINMPKLNGIELIKEVRKLNKEIPILVLSTESEQDMVKIGYEAGANGWIKKPFNPQQFVDIVKKVC